MGELLVSKSGLGYLIMYGSQVFNIDLVITAVIMLGILSFIMYFGISQLNKLTKKESRNRLSFTLKYHLTYYLSINLLFFLIGRHNNQQLQSLFHYLYNTLTLVS